MPNPGHADDPASLTTEPPVSGPCPPPVERRSLLSYLRAVGPGMMAGLADNDPAGIATYAIAGAVAGFSQLWLIVLATFMVQAVQVTSARVGDVTEQGILRLTRQRYGWQLAALAAVVGVVATEATLIADNAALGASLQLLTGVAWQWFVMPLTILMLLMTVFLDFRKLRDFFLVVGLSLLAYVVTALLVRPDWAQVLRSTLIPSFPSSPAEAASAMALLGTTVSPYLLFWEAEGEREAHRTHREFGLAEVDVTVGYVASNLVSYFIVVTAAATLYVDHLMIGSAVDAARALQPLAGDLASVIFAVGLLGTGLIAVPMFAISIGFIVADTFGWRSGLSKRVSEAPGFYAVVALAFLSGGLAGLLGVDPVVALFGSQILNGVLMPVLIVILAVLANDVRVMGHFGNTRYYNVWLAIAFVVMTAAAVLLILSLRGK